MKPLIEYAALQSRRNFLHNLGLSAGGIALAGLLGKKAWARPALNADDNYGSKGHPALAGFPHFKPRAKRLIYLHMTGAPSQIDMWDYKPGLKNMFAQDMPESVRMGQRITGMSTGQSQLPVAPSIFEFAQYGKSGTWVSELLPHTAQIVDDLTLIKTVNTTAINHDPAQAFMFTGSEIPGKPCIGSWLSYGLGSENEDLPAFVVMNPTWSTPVNPVAPSPRLWNSAFLPSRCSGVTLRDKGDPVLYIQNPLGVDRAARRDMLNALNQLNEETWKRLGDPETQTRIAQYEMAFRMQTAVPELTDFSNETKETFDLYGSESRTPGTFAASCLLARRLVERNVRVVQILHRGWDQHDNLPSQIKTQCHDVDQGCAALVQDLKQRGLLDDTLVVWGGEFGRTVYCQGKLTRDNYGRDHHPKNFCMWAAGGGMKAGLVHGETDDFSYNAVKDPVSLQELNATILHCMGIDHRIFSVRFQGLDQRLTGVEEVKAVKALLA